MQIYRDLILMRLSISNHLLIILTTSLVCHGSSLAGTSASDNSSSLL